MEKIPLIEKTFANDKNSITLRYPNVRYAKGNYLLRYTRPISHEMIMYNMKLCGFDVISFGEHNGAKTIIGTRCSNIDCNDTCQKPYFRYISAERLPLCKTCVSITRGINQSNKRPILAFKNSKKFKFESIEEAGRQLNISGRDVYNYLKTGKKHSSGYRFEFLD
ncbi:hypothetical protein [Bacillus sp. WC2507]|uniref:hypothetical protein n=1 Tax=Bacillus sp. WC2507 TaxID=3461404 RepID=UPI004042BBF8